LRALAGRALGLSAFPLERPAREASVKQLTARSDHLAVPRELAPAADDLLAEVRALPQQADPAPLNHVLAWAYLGNRADRLHRLLVECRLEAGAAICRLPDATAGGTDGRRARRSGRGMASDRLQAPAGSPAVPALTPYSSGGASTGGRGVSLSRPARFSASRSTYSIWALTLRSSSSAQRCTASSTGAEIRSG
jgi:hypothetical protein